MKNTSVFAIAATTSLFIAAAASAATATGAGGGITPDGPSGGVWPTTLPTGQYSSSVTLEAVASVKSITLTSISHTWVGDLQVVLFDPSGVGHNILCRPGFTGTGFGFSGDLSGTYKFQDGSPAFPTAGATPVAPGTYAPHSGIWVSGTLGILNGPLSGISGGAGSWTLKIYDWAAGDVGTIGSWTIDYNVVPAPGALALLGLAGLASRRRRA